jgi:adhesin/invasin
MTDAKGEYTVTLTAGTVAGAANIVAQVGFLRSPARQVLFVAGPPAAVAATAEKSSLPADGVSTTSVVVEVADAFGNPVPDQAVLLATSLGAIVPESTVTTGADGKATAILLTGTKAGTATVTAQAGAASGTAQVEFTASVFAPATIAVTSSVDRLVADGSSTAQVTALVRASNGSSVANVFVSFTTSLGSITNGGTTNANGEVVATLTAGTVAGLAQVVAEYAPGVVSPVKQVELVAGPPSQLNVSATAAALPADGVSETEVKLKVMDAYSNRVANQVVTLSTSLGTLVPGGSVTTDSNGEATVKLRAGVTAGMAVVSAQAGAASGSVQVEFTSVGPTQFKLFLPDTMKK